MIDQHWLHPLREKVQAVQHAPSPNSWNCTMACPEYGRCIDSSVQASQKRSLLGMDRPLRRFSKPWKICWHPRHCLCTSIWVWTLLELVLSVTLPLTMSVLCLLTAVQMAQSAPLSCSLSAAQCNYSQLERETLALVFGVQRFTVWASL